MACVRWRTSKSRVQNTTAAACACSLFTATKRMVGRCAASQIASASAMSFFCCLTNGFTSAGAMRRTVWPSLAISRPPIVSAATGLHGHRAGREGCEERQKLAAAQLLAKDHRARAVSPMKLKDVFGEIESDGANLVHGRLLEWALTPPLWHAEAVGGRPHHQARRARARDAPQAEARVCSSADGTA